jgi:hypothetical protein
VLPFAGAETPAGWSAATAGLTRDVQTDVEGLGGLESSKAGLADTLEKVIELGTGPDAAFAQDFHDVVKFVTNRLDKLASRRLAKIDTNLQNSVRPGNRDRQQEAGGHVMFALTFIRVHEYVACIDHLDEAAECGRPRGAFGDGALDTRAMGADSHDGVLVLRHDGLSRDDA